MNTYRVEIRLSKWNRSKAYDVDASRAGEAIRRALAGYPDSKVVTANCELIERQVTRHYSNARVRAVV